MPTIIMTDGITGMPYAVKDGTNLYDFMMERYPETGNFPVPTMAVFKSQPVMRIEWQTTKLHGDDVAVFVAVPLGGGGGSNPLSTVLTIATIALAAWVAPTAAMSVGAIIGRSVASAAIMVAGGLLSGALAGNNGISSGHMEPSKNQASSPTYSLNASTNQARLFQCLPSLFGRMLFLPDVGASPYGIYTGNEMYLHQVFACGLGRLEVEALGYGEINFWEKGHLVDSAFTTDGEGHSISFSEEMKAPNMDGDWSEPQVVAPQFGACRNINLQVHFPDGLCSYKLNPSWREVTEWDSGRPIGYKRHPASWSVIGHSVSYVFQIREIDTKGNPVEGWRDFASGTWTNNTEAAFGVTVKGSRQKLWARYEIRGRVTSNARGTITENDPGYYGPNLHTTQARERVIWNGASTILASVQVEFVEPGEAVTLFPDKVYTSTSVGGQELKAPNNSGEWIGPFPVCEPGRKVTRILNDIVFPRGLGWLNNKGNLQNYAVSWQIDYQAIDDKNNPLGARAPLNYGTLSMATMEAQKRTLANDVPEGRYWVWARRSSHSNGDTRTIDTLQWESLKGVSPGTLKYEQSMIALRIRSTNLSVATSERFKVIGTRKLPLYDRKTKTWSEEVPTRSFAAAVCHVCKSDYGGKLVDSQIDLETLWRLDEEATKRGWYFDAWVDGPYINWQLVVEICKVMRVIPQPSGSILTFVMDRADRPVQHIFTPRDIIRNSLMPHYNNYDDDSPDDVIVTYLDEAAGFAKRDVRAVLPGSESLQPSQQQPIGIVNRDHAHAYGVHLTASNRYRRIYVEFGTEGVGRLLSVGDVIMINHPRLRGTDSGKFEDWDEGSLVVLVDHPVTVSGMNYLAIGTPTGGVWGPVKIDWIDGEYIKFDAEDYANLLMQGFGNPFEWISKGYDRNPTVWTLMEGNDFQESRFLVQGIRSTGEYTYAISAVNDDPRVYSQDIPVPPWDYDGLDDAASALDAPGGLHGNFIEGADGGLSVKATWTNVVGASWYVVEYSTDGVTWTGKGRSNINAITFSIGEGDCFVRVAGANDKAQGPWAEWQGNTNILPPDTPNPTLSAPYLHGEISVLWEPVARATSYVVSVFADGVAGVEPVRTLAITGTSYQYTKDMGVADGGPWRKLTIQVEAVGEAGSSGAGVVEVQDMAPDSIPAESVQITASADTVTIDSNAVLPPDATGFVIAMGTVEDFQLSDVAGFMSVGGLPYVWGNLTPDRDYYFRIAVKDSFTDASGNLLDLNYSEAFMVKTTAVDNG